MIKVYIFGHGVMSRIGDMAPDSDTVLRYGLYTYVQPGTMYDGNGTPKVIDSGGGPDTYKPAYLSSREAMQDAYAEKYTMIPTHWVLSDRLQSFGDLKGCAKFDQAKKTKGWPGSALIALGADGGLLYKLDGESYVYMSSPGVLTSIRVVQELLAEKIFEELELHWLACRSFIGGRSPVDVFKNAVGNMPGVEPVKVWG